MKVCYLPPFNEITKINEFENKWKIKTNQNKFKIVPIGVKRRNQIIINGNIIEYSLHGKFLGLSIGRTGIKQHVNETINKAKNRLTELFRFRQLPTNIKIHLIKAFLIPILTYPSIPLVTTSQSTQNSLQKVHNKALRFALNERHSNGTTKEQHEAAKIEPISFILYSRAANIFRKTINLEDPHMDYILENYEDNKNHLYYKNTRNVLNRGPPGKIYATH